MTGFPLAWGRNSFFRRAFFKKLIDRRLYSQAAILQRALPEDIAGLVSSFSRADSATDATQQSAAGVNSTVATGIRRVSHFVGGVRTLLLEPLAKNYVKWAEPIDYTSSHWGKSAGTETTTLGQSDPDGGTGATLLTTVSTNGNASCLSMGLAVGGRSFVKVTMKAGTGTASRIDYNGASRRARLNIAWAAGVPTLTDADANMLAKGAISRGNGWYDIWFITANTIVAANSNVINIYAETVAAGGTILLYQPMVCDAGQWQSYIAGNTGTTQNQRGLDALVLVGRVCAGPATLYTRYYDTLTSAWVDAVAAYTPGATITPAVSTGRAYDHAGTVLAGTLSLAQARQIVQR